MTGRLEKLITIGLLAAIVFSSLAHGVVEPWSVAVFQLLISTLLLLRILQYLTEGGGVIIIPKAALPLAGLLLIGLAQSIALTGADGRLRSLSMDVSATRRCSLMLVLLIALLLIANHSFSSTKRLRALVSFFIIYGFILAVFALVQHFTWNGSFYWLRPISLELNAFGPFVNRNHYAGYMEMLIPLPVALVLGKAVRAEARLFCVFAAAIMGISLMVSLSRGGMLSLAAGMLFILAASPGLGRAEPKSEDADKDSGNWRGQPFVRVGIVLGLAALIVLGVFWIGSDPVVDRIARSSVIGRAPDAREFSRERGWIWKDTIEMIKANPMTGVGLGAFQTAYPIYTARSESFEVSESHNDYLQVVADAGLPGTILALWFLVIIMRNIWRGIRQQDSLLSSLALGAGGGIVAILVHSLFDFNLQLPSNAVLFLFQVVIVSRASIATSSPPVIGRKEGLKSRRSTPLPAQARAASHP